MTNDENSRVAFETGVPFRKKVSKAKGHSKALQQVHVQLQTMGLSRLKGQTLPDGFFGMVEANNSVPNHPLNGLKIKNAHSKLGNKHENNHAYCRGILKIAKREESTLTPEEEVGHLMLSSSLFHCPHFHFLNLQAAVEPLLKVNHPWYQEQHMQVESDGEDGSVNDPDFDPVANFDVLQNLFAINDKQDEELMEKDSKYVNVSFKLSSAAIVEILWSKFDAICTQRRFGLSPVMIEGLLYLKENRHLWTIDTVAEALEIIKKREMTERVNKKAAMLKEQEAMIIAGAAALGLGGADTVDMTAESD